MLTSYGVGREPCTAAAASPGPTRSPITWPLRA